MENRDKTLQATEKDALKETLILMHHLKNSFLRS